MAEPEARGSVAALLRPLCHHRGLAGSALALGSAASLAAVALAATSAWLIDRAAERPGLTALTAAMCLVQALAFSKAGLGYAERLENHDLAFRLLAGLRVRVFAALARLAPAGLNDHRTGDVLSRYVDDVDRLQNLYISTWPLTVTSAITIAGSVAAAGLLVPNAALLLAAGLCANGVAVPVLAGRLAARPEARLAGCRAELAAEVSDFVAAAPELDAANRLEPSLSRLGVLEAALERAGAQSTRRRAACEMAAALVAGATALLLLLLASQAVAGGQLPRVDLAVLPVLALAAFASVAALPGALAALPGALEAARRLAELEQSPPPVVEPVAPVPITPGPQALRFASATVRYPSSERTALAGFSAELPPGHRLGLAGPSGSGKSSAVAALLRLVGLEGGQVLLGETDVAACSSRELTATVAALRADDHVFAGTIEDNLLLARPGASRAELWDALRGAGLEETVAAYPEGLSSFVGEQGSLLSGGERQRLCLARVLLRDAEVLVFDEPTANLDETTAARVLSQALEAAGGRTVVVVSHRHDELASMDEVLTLERGSVVSSIERADERAVR